MTADNPRFQFENGQEMNPFNIFKALSGGEQYICSRLANSGGFLGWNKRNVNNAHIKISEVEALVEQGIIRKDNLYQIAKNMVEDEDYRKEKADLDKEGGFLALTSARDRQFFHQFDLATDIVQKGEEQHQEVRYQIVRKGLYDFIRMISR